MGLDQPKSENFVGYLLESRLDCHSQISKEILKKDWKGNWNSHSSGMTICFLLE